MNRFKKIKKASIIGIISNLFLCIIKLIISFITNSQAMFADAFNSAGDILSSVITFIGNKIASKPKDDDHNLGHGKAEYIYSMLFSLVMIASGFVIFRTSYLSVYTSKTYGFSIWLIIVCLISIIIKLSLYFYTRETAKKVNSLLLEANSKDHRNDAILTSLNFISIILSLYNIKFVDGLVGMIIAIWIMISSIKIFLKSYDVLMDKSISNGTKKQVYEIIKNYDEIKRVNHFNSTPIGYKYQISFTIFVDGSLSTYESHEIADRLEKEITKKIDEIYLAVIHVNPIEIKKSK